MLLKWPNWFCRRQRRPRNCTATCPREGVRILHSSLSGMRSCITTLRCICTTTSSLMPRYALFRTQPNQRWVARLHPARTHAPKWKGFITAHCIFQLSRSHVLSKERMSEIRVSQTAWLDNSTHPALPRINRRISDVTGLHVFEGPFENRGGEPLQVSESDRVNCRKKIWMSIHDSTNHDIFHTDITSLLKS